jgi:hypothetical protein
MSIKRVVAGGFSAAVLIAAPFAVATTASARGGVTQVDGLLTPETTGQVCNRDLPFEAAYTVTGTLEGCWFIEHTTYDHTNHAGGFVASGTEEFHGCLAGTDRCGSFFTRFKFTAKYDGSVEEHGRCHHPIVEELGTEGFTGVGGVINMHDLPNGCAIYTGHLDLSA